MNDRTQKSETLIKEREFIWKRTRFRVMLATQLVLASLAILIAFLTNEAKVETTTTPIPSPTETPVLTPSPELVTVEYQLITESDSPISLTLLVWYSNGVNQREQEEKRGFQNGELYTFEVQVPRDTFVELFAAVQNTGSGKLTCRIIVADTVIQETTSQGIETGVYCSGLASS